MVNKIAYTQNGKIIIESIDSRMDPQIFIDRFIGRGFADSIIIDTDNLPNNNYYEAWEISGDSIIENITKAKTIFLEQLRNQRESLFLELDKLTVEAATQYKVLSEIQARQIYLRNLPEDPAIDAATTIAELDAITIAPWTAPLVKNLDYTNNFFRTEVNDNPYALTSSDEFVGVKYTTTSAVLITLPEISTINKVKYTIKDEGGNAGTNNIVIERSGTDTIDGQPSITISTNYGSINLYHDNSGKWYTY